jgi:septum formation protein
VSFEVKPAGVKEVVEGDPEAAARENAVRKARAVAAAASEGGDARVLGADTIVALGERILDKPATEEGAREWLEMLSGRTHRVIGGLCLVDDGAERAATAVTEVEFRALGQAEVDWYLASGEWRERAGGYAIQGRGAALVRGIRGDYLNVVGLPVAALLDLVPELLDNPQASAEP